LDLFPLWLSLKVAGLATAAALVAGVGLAYLGAGRRGLTQDLTDAVLTLPLVLPPTVLGYYLLVVFGRRGWLGGWLDHTLGVSLVFTWQGAVVAAAVVSLPLVFRSAKAAFEAVDPHFAGAARTLGLSEPAVFARVALPLAWRGILSGAMLAFARAMGEFGATLMIAGNLPGRTQTLSLALYDAAQAGNDRLASTLVLLTSATCVGILLVSGRLLRARW
jgi:molybdate transport system permease protein